MGSDFTAETLEPAIPQSLADSAKRVVDLAHDRSVRLATAESCTGGMLATLLTDIRGRGHVFDCGIVSYSNDAKGKLLNVGADVLDGPGAVSKPAALAMAHGVLAASGADLAVSITGFAGPGAPGDEEGLVHFACARRSGPCAHREEHFGAIGRAGVRIAALEVALAMMEDALAR